MSFIDSGNLPSKPLVPEQRQLHPQITTADWGLVLEALTDLRTATLEPTLFSDPTASLSTGTDVKLRNNAGILQVSSAGGAYQDVATSVATTAAMTLYVDAAGNDANDGSISSPLLTIQAAINKIPKRVRHPVNVMVGVGTFSGYQVVGFNIDPLENSPTSAYINVQGTYSLSTLATGTSSGTLTSSTTGSSTTVTRTVLTDSTQTWTVNDLKGRFVKITSGAQSGMIFPILSNTATAITILYSGAVAVGTYQILECATIINANLSGTRLMNTSQVDVVLSGSATNSIICAGNLQPIVSDSQSAIRFSAQKLGRVNFCGPANILVQGSVLTSTNPLVNVGGTSLLMESCFFPMGTSLNGSVNHNNANSSISATRCYFYYSSVVNGVSFVGTKRATITLSDVESEANRFMDYSTVGSNGTSILLSGVKWAGATGISFSDAAAQGSTIKTIGGVNFTASGTAFLMYGLGTFLLTSTVAGSALNVLDIRRGGTVQFSAASTITGSANDISLDGITTSTFAAMRAASPKLVSSVYGSMVYE